MLLELFKKLEPMFEKDGLLAKLYPLYEGAFTLFFSSGKVSSVISSRADSRSCIRKPVVPELPSI